ncbi:hypothetical protein ASD15_11790 [Massilia sp. Root351]|jgi:hypothetical protein|uniref:hypothetical protein n=1 Tax=Massilia sp. Root351 TaxID=1736522 RepID=UPI000708EF27|nr:hypothetical protein [Massilia sp. Root351]KQV80620.1 hypothetical protein ASD15_11790 [Massilia sp. Root351]
MSAYEFDLSRYAERLEMAGVPGEQALLHAELTAETLQQLVTKDYLHSELLAQEARMDARFAAFEARMETSLAKLQADLFRWLCIAVFVQGGFILACLKLLA